MLPPRRRVRRRARRSARSVEDGCTRRGRSAVVLAAMAKSRRPQLIRDPVDRRADAPRCCMLNWARCTGYGSATGLGSDRSGTIRSTGSITDVLRTGPYRPGPGSGTASRPRAGPPVLRTVHSSNARIAVLFAGLCSHDDRTNYQHCEQRGRESAEGTKGGEMATSIAAYRGEAGENVTHQLRPSTSARPASR